MDDSKFQSGMAQNAAAFVYFNEIKNENQKLIEFENHRFLVDPYQDMAKRQVARKSTQVGWSTLAIIRAIHIANFMEANVIYCVDEETEILTKRGWLKQEEVKDTDLALTLTSEEKSRWSPITEIFRKEVDMDLVSLETNTFSALVTPNHRWFVKNAWISLLDEGLKVVETHELIKGNYIIPKRVKLKEYPQKLYSDDFVELASWCLTEGWYDHKDSQNHTTIRIAQSEKVNQNYVDEIRALIKNLGIAGRYGTKSKEYFLKENNCRYFSIQGEIPKKIRQLFPQKELTFEFVNQLTNEQLEILIETYIKADGFESSNGKHQRGLICKDKQTAEAFALACLLAGYGASTKKRTQKDGCYVTKQLISRNIYTKNIVSKTVPYKGIIWCPRTRDGNFMARRNGYSFWTGNTLPSKSVVKDFVTPKVDPLIETNPQIKAMIGDTNSAGLKAVGKRFIYFRGSWEQSSAISISGDVLINDEYDRSNQLVLETYKTRLDASAINNPNMGFEWHFSNPSTPGAGVDALWEESDQKHWYITCSRCNKEQYLEWPDNIDIKKAQYICKHCKRPLSSEDRRDGRWLRHRFTDISGYWINQLMVPWIPAERIIRNSKKDPQIFHNFTLGLPYVSSEDKISEEMIRKAIILEENPRTDVAIGVDVGLVKHYVIGNRYGVFRMGTCNTWEEIEDLRNRYQAYMVIDAMPMPDPVMRLVQKYTGKVFMSYFSENKKQLEVVEWGDGDKTGVVYSDRTKIIDAIVADIRSGDLVFNMTPDALKDFISHALAMYRVVIEEETPEGGKTGKVTQRWLTIGSRPDHLMFALIYFRLALLQTLSGGAVIRPEKPAKTDLMPPIHVDEYGRTMGINIDDAVKALEAEGRRRTRTR